MKYFDAHCHIQFPQYDEDRKKLCLSMKDAGVGGLIVGVDAASSEAAIQNATEFGTFVPLFASAGLHPNHADELFDEEKFRALLKHPKVVAVGECGLDYYRPEDAESVKGLQKTVFEKHIVLAVELEKPLMIHARPAKGSLNAYHDLIDILRSRKKEYGDKLSGNVHFFVGGVEEARALLELDFTISYTAVLTFTSDYDEAVRFMPLSHILSETDSPYVAPVVSRGERNIPLAVRDVVRALARIRGTDEETIREAVLENAKRLFKLSAS
ncbi:TatD family hydrolase [Candidatus Parcubacteria bacterium]|nr:TatD family hydrolase [Candidatus Parcubacteria bacterium]